MKRLLWIIVFAACAVAQEPALHLDLAGPWRMHAGDDPAFARPDFDDSAWTIVNAPFPAERPTGFWWLRRTVSVPKWLPANTPLALSTGAFNQIFEVFVNGERIAAVGAPTIYESRIARPRTFPIPVGLIRPGQPAVIAIRVWKPDGLYPRSIEVTAQSPDRGPWLITTLEHAPPPDEGRQLALRESRSRRSALTATFYALLALLVLVAWTFQRRHRELLYFAGFCLAEAINAAGIFAIIVFDLPLSTLTMTAIALPVSPLALALFAPRVLPGFLPQAALPAALTLALHAAGNLYHLLSAQADFHLRWYTWTTLPPDILTAVLMAVGSVQATRIALRRSDRQSALLAMLIGLLAVLVSAPVRIMGFLSAAAQSWAGFIGPVFAIWVTLRMLAGLGAARQRLANELEAARIVQQLLLPPSSGSGIEAAYIPAQEVGGDFWQCIPLAGGEQLIVVGDVSGKGLRAAMITALVVGAIRARSSLAPAQLLTELNRVLLGNAGFVTACALRVDAVGHAVIANAGHPNPYLDGRELELPPGLPLGVAPDVAYAEVAVPPGRFTFVSDGVVEAANARGELLGFDRTRELARGSAAEIAEAARAWGQTDDITVVTVRRAHA